MQRVWPRLLWQGRVLHGHGLTVAGPSHIVDREGVLK
jgi:hypothetical protein